MKAQYHIILAPMQGLVDDVMRQLLTQIGGIDECVTEFVRITHTLHSKRTWLKYMPELRSNNLTASGCPVTLQLLGSDADNLANNALEAVRLGVNKIDLNFGCPAPTVNQHQGGAILLNHPEKIRHIVQTMRNRLPEHVILTAKMRLGYENTNRALECAAAIADAGAQALTVHARTKVEGYTPPAHWNWIRRIRESVTIPIIANGDVFSLQDYIQIKLVSGCEQVMLGRGAVMMPDLALQICAYENHQPIQAWTWQDLYPWIQDFFQLCCLKITNPSYPVARLKQWLGMLKKCYPQAEKLFAQIRTLKTIDDVARVLNNPSDTFES